MNIATLFNAMPGALAQGLIWAIMAIGVYLTFRILDVADLTVDGTLGLGGAVCIMCMISGMNVWLALLVAVLAGLATGLVTGLLHTFMGIPAILAGILTQFALWSVNLRILGGANQAISADKYDLLTSLRYLGNSNIPFWKNPLVMISVFLVVVIALLYWFFGTEMGCSLRATGANQNMARAQGINTDFCKVLGLMVSNGLVGLSGALLSQYQGFADINMGRGSIVIGGNGAGKSTLMNAIAGAWPVDEGSIIIDGVDVTKLSEHKRAAFIGRVFQDPMKGTAPNMTIEENLIAVRLDQPPFTKGIMMNKSGQDAYAKEMVEQFDIRPADYNLPTSSLSGGNAQKVVVAREVSLGNKLLVASQPTRGVDIGAIELIRNTLEKAKKAGAGVLLVSAELEEIISLSDRIVVIHEGKITGEMRADEANENNLGLLMMGGTDTGKDGEAAV